MTIVGFVGSPRKNGNCDLMVQTALKAAEEQGAETKLIYLNDLNIRGCQACMHCRSNYECATKDDMQSIYEDIIEADGIVIGASINMYSLNSQTKNFIDRLFPFLNPDFTAKIAKPTLLLVSQGRPDTTTFKANIDSAAAAITLCGLVVSETIISGDGREKGSVTNNTEIMDAIKKAGAALVSPPEDWAS